MFEVFASLSLEESIRLSWTCITLWREAGVFVAQKTYWVPSLCAQSSRAAFAPLSKEHQLSIWQMRHARPLDDVKAATQAVKQKPNELCKCRSGKKFKKCCGAVTKTEVVRARAATAATAASPFMKCCETLVSNRAV